jgi:uncharacterized protein (UPF0548 family)
MAEVRVFSNVDAGALLTSLRRADLNFDRADLDTASSRRHWRVDRYRRALAAEPVGDPVPGGAWFIACDLSTNYGFVDPSIIRSFYDPRHPLENRTLLLEVHFWGLRVYVGVRVGAVYDVTRRQRDAAERVHGWCYETLEGHFEQGRICYEVAKRLDTGQVEFRIDALSRRADPGNPLVASGFAVFGRRKQAEFARTACERMVQLTRARLEGKKGEPGVAVEDYV